VSKPMKDILGGVAVIAIGLFMGGSIFTGNADTLDIVFDAVGIVLILKGGIGLLSSGQSESEGPRRPTPRGP
jgi:hypothetical protein